MDKYLILTPKHPKSIEFYSKTFDGKLARKSMFNHVEFRYSILGILQRAVSSNFSRFSFTFATLFIHTLFGITKMNCLKLLYLVNIGQDEGKYCYSIVSVLVYGFQVLFGSLC